MTRAGEDPQMHRDGGGEAVCLAAVIKFLFFLFVFLVTKDRVSRKPIPPQDNNNMDQNQENNGTNRGLGQQ